MSDIVWKGLLGGLVTAVIVWASKKGDVLPGILPLAPIFAIIALLAVGAKGHPAGFREAAVAGMKTLPAYFVFLAACWLTIGRMDYRLAILCGLAAWLLAAGATFLLPRWLNP